MVLKVNTDCYMSGMNLGMLISKYNENAFPEHPTMRFDFRGDCSDYCFPESTNGFVTMFGNVVSLQRIKLWGHEYRWRLSKKRNGEASVHLRIYHRGEKFAYHFKKKGFNDLITCEQLIEQLATKEHYVGLFPELEPVIEHRWRLVNSLDEKTTAELLEEVSRRYKAEMPDWATAINPPSEPEDMKLAAILAA